MGFAGWDGVRRFAPVGANTPPYRDETAKGWGTRRRWLGEVGVEKRISPLRRSQMRERLRSEMMIFWLVRMVKQKQIPSLRCGMTTKRRLQLQVQLQLQLHGSFSGLRRGLCRVLLF